MSELETRFGGRAWWIFFLQSLAYVTMYYYRTIENVRRTLQAKILLVSDVNSEKSDSRIVWEASNKKARAVNLIDKVVATN
jgi:hypothetical protein